jgi:hypothetical protein
VTSSERRIPQGCWPGDLAREEDLNSAMSGNKMVSAFRVSSDTNVYE